jgi:colicin import membrane protein
VKKWLGALLGLSLLMGCSANEPTEEATAEESGPTQEELDAQLKDEATAADFVELNSDDAETGKKVYAEGTVDVILEEGVIQSLSFSTDDGMYTLANASGTKVSEGDQVKVYGVYSGKDETGIPKIDVSIIE